MEIPLNSVRRWLFTTNHKDVGILYFITSLYFLVVGGALAVLMRLQLMAPGLNILQSAPFNQAVTVHGLVMVLWFLSPLAFAFANYFVPLQIGARDLAFPRLNAMSYWFYLFGGLLAAIGFFTPGGAIDTGWTVYAPLNTAKYSPQLGVTLGGAGLLMLIASVTMSTVNFLVTIFRSRAPGMTLWRMPIYTWGILLTVFMMLFAFPSVAAGVIMLAADRLLGTLYFSSVEGGAILWDHLFWFFGHPEVYIVLVPGLVAIAEVLPVFARKPLYGKKILITALIIGSIMSFMVWAHHMFVTGIDPGFRKFMTITTETISIPFGVATLAFILTLVGASIRFTTPMLFALGGVALFIIGGITGVFNSSVALDYYLRGTYWIVAHFHYTLVGGATTGLIAALYYWWPKMTGRMFNEKLGKLHFIVYMIGFNLLYFPMHFLIDMPRRVFTYPAGMGWELPNMLATMGTIVFALSWLILFINLYQSLRKGEPAGNNPWGAWSLEWLVPSPPPRHNYDGQPVVKADGTITIQPIPANGGHHIHETHYSKWPLFISLGMFVTFLGVGLGLPVLLLGALILIGSIVGWAKEKFIAVEPAEGERWPFANVERVRLGVWTLLFGEVVLFGALIGSYIFVRINSATWPAPGEFLNPMEGAINTFILVTSSLTAILALAGAKSGNQGLLRGGLIATFILGFIFLFNKGREWSELFSHGITFSSGLPATTYYITTGAHGMHVAAGLAVLIYLIIHAFKGRITKENHAGLEGFDLYWHFVDIVWLFLFPLFYLI